MLQACVPVCSEATAPFCHPGAASCLRCMHIHILPPHHIYLTLGACCPKVSLAGGERNVAVRQAALLEAGAWEGGVAGGGS